MKIEIELKKEFTIRDWKRCKDAIDRHFLKEFGLNENIGDSKSISTLSGPNSYDIHINPFKHLAQVKEEIEII